MDFNKKTYQHLKTRKHFKNYDFFFIFHSIKLNSQDWVLIEQSFKKLKLKQYKILNKISYKIISNSIFKNYSKLICGLIVLVKPDINNNITLNILKKELKNQFILLSLKLNNKIYLISQITEIKNFSFKQNVFNLYKILEKSTKTSYIYKKQFETM